MAHRGKLYHYALRRDLTVIREWPNLWANRLVWSLDTLANGPLFGPTRAGVVSGPCQNPHLSGLLTWQFDFPRPGGQSYHCVFSMEVVDSRGTPKFQFHFQHNTVAAWFSDITFDQPSQIDQIEWPQFDWSTSQVPPQPVNNDPAWSWGWFSFPFTFLILDYVPWPTE